MNEHTHGIYQDDIDEPVVYRIHRSDEPHGDYESQGMNNACERLAEVEKINVAWDEAVIKAGGGTATFDHRAASRHFFKWIGTEEAELRRLAGLPASPEATQDTKEE